MRTRIACFMLFLMFIFTETAWAENTQDLEATLCTEKWKAVTATLELHEDHTGIMTNSQGMSFDIEWALDGEMLTYTYELYGTRSASLVLSQSDDVYKLAAADGSSAFFMESQYDRLMAEGSKNANLYATQIGEEINLGFVKMSFSSAEIAKMIGGKMMYLPTQAGMQFFCLVGTIENTAGVELPISRIRAEMVFNGEYTYNASASAIYSDKKNETLPALTNGEYRIYASIPDALVDSMTSCTVRFSLNDQFKTAPDFLADGEFGFEIALGNELVTQAKEGPTREKVYFEECPILPDPTSYVDVFQSGRNSSSINGKVSAIKYRFRAQIYAGDGQPLFKTYLEKLADEGFSVKETSSGKYTISDGGNKLAEIVLSADEMQIDIVPGNEKLRRSEAPAVQTEEKEETHLTVGDGVKLNYVEMSFEQSGTTKQIFSSITKPSGRYFTYDATDAEPFYYLFGTFKNVGGRAVDIRNIYAEFEFDGKYTFSGSVAGVNSGASDFINQVSPLSEIKYYIYAPVSKELLSSYETCIVHIGFTRGFDAKVRSNGGYNFNLCDDTFDIELKREGTSALSSTSSSESSGSGQVRIRKGGNVNVRAESNSDSKKVGSAKAGATYPYLGVADNGWYKIQLEDGTVGYVSPNMSTLEQ